MDTDNRQLFRNASLTVAQVMLSAIFLFTVYKYLLKAIGAEQMGIWSIVMALSSVARSTDLGFAGGMTRFVAKYQALEDHEAVLEVVETGTVSLALLVTLILAIAYPLLHLGLARMIAPEPARLALQLLPFSLLSFGLLAVAGAFLSTLDGLQRADLRNLILMTGTVLYGGLIPLCVWRWGFVGLGWAQCGQTVAVLVLAWWQVRRRLGLGWLPCHWRRSRFHEMLGYNVHLQVTTFASFLGEPLTKLMLGHFGSLAMVTYYEMAGKLISQFRAIVVNVNQVLVPAIARAHENDQGSLQTIFNQSFSTLLLVSLWFYSIVLMTLHLASSVWIGHYNPTFVHSALVLVLTMQLNTLVGPAYFANMGTGQVQENARSHLVAGGCNLLLGLTLGNAFGGWGVVASFGISIALGSISLMRRFLQHQNYRTEALRPPHSRRLLAAGILAITTFTLIDTTLYDSSPVRWIAPILGVLMVSTLLWRPVADNEVLGAIRNMITARRYRFAKRT